jgi:integrative and conjugative element protein (TIGR02256 family)
MQVLLAPQVTKRLQRELRRAGSREIGGLLLAEHVGEELFRVVEISVQSSGGTHVGFMRDPRWHRRQLNSFFRRTGEDYTRFNYLGEWHSHPSFSVDPSPTDIETMQSIVENPAVAVNFLVLVVCKLNAVVCKLNAAGAVEASSTAFVAHTVPAHVTLAFEEDTTPTMGQRFRNFFGF